MSISARDKRKKLRDILNGNKCVPVPGVIDALGARIVEEAGFEAAFIGSYALAACGYAFPDVGLVTLTESLQAYKHIADAIDIPLIVDGEQGYYHAANIWRTVKETEDAGIAGMHIEDHEIGKHMKFPPQIYDTEKMCNKIKAAVDARTDENFIIIARTDAAWITKDIDIAIERANRYLEAGADAAYVIGADIVPDIFPNDLAKRVHGPLVGVSCPGVTVEQQTAQGLKLSLYWTLCMSAAFGAQKEVLEKFKATGDYQTALGKYAFDEKLINQYTHVDEFQYRADKYMNLQ